MEMRTSLAGAFAIIGHEAIVLSRYRDARGIWTIGIGHTASAGAPDPAAFTGTMTLPEAIELFRRDLARFEKRVNAAFTVKLRQHEFDAAVSFDFNTGAIHNATWVRLFNQGRREQAAVAMMNWSKPRALEARRKKEQALFRTGLYPGGGSATLYPATPDGRVEWTRGRPVDLASALAVSRPRYLPPRRLRPKRRTRAPRSSSSPSPSWQRPPPFSSE